MAWYSFWRAGVSLALSIRPAPPWMTMAMGWARFADSEIIVSVSSNAGSILYMVNWQWSGCLGVPSYSSGLELINSKLPSFSAAMGASDLSKSSGLRPKPTVFTRTFLSLLRSAIKRRTGRSLPTLKMPSVISQMVSGWLFPKASRNAPRGSVPPAAMIAFTQGLTRAMLSLVAGSGSPSIGKLAL